MKIVYISNILNHYQYALAKSFCKVKGVEFYFISTTPLSEERRKLCIPDYNHIFENCICAMDSKEEEKKAFKLFLEADVGIIGATPKQFKYIYKKRIFENKLTFFAQERNYKKEPSKIGMPLRFLKYFFEHTIHRNLYMLCASAYTSYDYSRTFNYKNKAFKWGYFPELKKYDFDNLMRLKIKKEKISIVWAARYLNWKHPEAMIYLAKKLLENNYSNFVINMIGTGELLENIKNQIANYKLGDYVKVLGSLSPSEVRKYMEEANIFAFTSDRGEGWGVVLNEAMNSGCVPVASFDIGSVPYLIKNNINGCIFESQNWNNLYEKVKFLFDNKEIMRRYAKESYNTIQQLWNPDIAAERFCSLSSSILEKQKIKFDDGPCSISDNLRDNWFIER